MGVITWNPGLEPKTQTHKAKPNKMGESFDFFYSLVKYLKFLTLHTTLIDTTLNACAHDRSTLIWEIALIKWV